MLGIVLLVQQVESHILQPLIGGEQCHLRKPAGRDFLGGRRLHDFRCCGRAVRGADASRGELGGALPGGSRLQNHDPSLRDEEFLFPHEVARREHAEEKAQERQESVKSWPPSAAPSEG